MISDIRKPLSNMLIKEGIVILNLENISVKETIEHIEIEG